MKIIDETINEEQFQRQVIELAGLKGWLVAHFRPAKVDDGNGGYTYRTAVSADGKGFPDMVLAKKNHEVIFAEIKSESGKLSAEQTTWYVTLKQCPGVKAFVWKPRDWDEILKVLGE